MFLRKKSMIGMFIMFNGLFSGIRMWGEATDNGRNR